MDNNKIRESISYSNKTQGMDMSSKKENIRYIIKLRRLARWKKWKKENKKTLLLPFQ